VWREGYPGGLSETEEAFADAMVALAGRRRRRRRVAVVAVFVITAVVATATTTLWRRSVQETLRAEAGKLLALGQAELEDDPTAALAYARASLEQADSPEARRFAVEALWSGPVARMLPMRRMAREAGLWDDPIGILRTALSPDGRLFAAVVGNKRQVLLFAADGGPPRALPRQPDGNVDVLAFGPRGDLLVTGGSGASMRFWSVPELEEIRSVELGGRGSGGGVRGGRLLTFTRVDDAERDWLWRIWPLPEGQPEIVESRPNPFHVDAGLTVVAYGRERSVLLSPLEPASGSKGRVIGEAGDVVRDVAVSPDGDRVATLDGSGEIRVWSTAEGDVGPLHSFQGPPYEIASTWFDPAGRTVTQAAPQDSFLLWDLDSPPGTDPRVVRRRVPSTGSWCKFDFEGNWLVTEIEDDVAEFWSLASPWARTFRFRDFSSTIWDLEFTNDCRFLATCPVMQHAQLWPLNAEDGGPRDLVETEPCCDLTVSLARDEIVVGTARGEVLLSPISGGPPRTLPGGFAGTGMVAFIGVDPEGHRVAASPYAWEGGIADPARRVLRVWDLASGQEQVFSVAHLTDRNWTGAFNPDFAHDGSLYMPLASGGGLMRLTLPTEPGGEISAETMVSAGSSWPIVSRDGRFLLVHTSDATETEKGIRFQYERLLLFDLVKGTSRRITTHGNRLTKVSQVDSTGRILVTGDIDGVVRAGPVTGEEPHLLLGHEGFIKGLTISPDGRWIASSSDESVRLWPMPDVTKTPLHTLPRQELIAKLKTLTNLRVVRDEESSTGWKLEVGPFPGWETVPTW
jgi:WD40 repeat protein